MGCILAPRESLETEMEEEAWFPVAQYVCHEEGSRSRSEWFRVVHSSFSLLIEIFRENDFRIESIHGESKIRTCEG